MGVDGRAELLVALGALRSREADAQAHVVWVYISYLRRKLQTLQANVQIRVVRGVGYMLEAIT